MPTENCCGQTLHAGRPPHPARHARPASNHKHMRDAVKPVACTRVAPGASCTGGPSLAVYSCRAPRRTLSTGLCAGKPGCPLPQQPGLVPPIPNRFIQAAGACWQPRAQAPQGDETAYVVKAAYGNMTTSAWTAQKLTLQKSFGCAGRAFTGDPHHSLRGHASQYRWRTLRPPLGNQLVAHAAGACSGAVHAFVSARHCHDPHQPTCFCPAAHGLHKTLPDSPQPVPLQGAAACAAHAAGAAAAPARQCSVRCRALS